MCLCQAERHEVCHEFYAKGCKRSAATCPEGNYYQPISLMFAAKYLNFTQNCIIGE